MSTPNSYQLYSLTPCARIHCLPLAQIHPQRRTDARGNHRAGLRQRSDQRARHVHVPRCDNGTPVHCRVHGRRGRLPGESPGFAVTASQATDTAGAAARRLGHIVFAAEQFVWQTAPINDDRSIGSIRRQAYFRPGAGVVVFGWRRARCRQLLTVLLRSNKMNILPLSRAHIQYNAHALTYDTGTQTYTHFIFQSN